MMTVYYRPNYRAFIPEETEQYGQTNKVVDMPYYKYTPTGDGHYTRETVPDMADLPKPLRNKIFEEADKDFFVTVSCCGVKKLNAQAYYVYAAITQLSDPTGDDESMNDPLSGKLLPKNQTFGITNIRPYRRSRTRSGVEISVNSLNALNGAADRARTYSDGGTLLNEPARLSL
jgi:hypothetical protein